MQGKALTFLEGFWRDLVNVSVGYCKNSVKSKGLTDRS